MKRSLIVHLVVMLVAVLVGSHLASILNAHHGKLATSQAMLSKSPLGGCHKFAAGIQWMLFINYCGSLDVIDESNADEVFRRLQVILRNNPDFEKAYEVGGLMLSVAAPEQAVEILDMGTRNPRLRSNWQLPFLAGYVIIQHTKDPDLEQAQRFFREAVSRSVPPEPHVVSSLNRIRARHILSGGTDQNITLVNQKQAMIHALLNDWRQAQRSMQTEFVGDSLQFDNIPVRMLQAVREAREEAPDDEHVRQSIALAKNTVLKGQHLCEKCFASYQAGDKFCTACSNQVETYGTCTSCGSLLKGRFCHQCGHDNR